MHLDPSGLKLTEYRGGLALAGPSLRAAFDTFASGTPPHTLHITLLTAAERKSYTPDADVPLTHVYVLGPAASKGVRWLVALWNHGDVLRAALGLRRKAYHMTLSDVDDHGLDKSVDAFLRPGQDPIMSLDEVALDHAVLAATDVQLKTQLAEHLITSHPESYRGYARLAAATNTPLLAAAAYARAAALHPPLVPTAARALARLRDVVPFGALSERDLASLPPSLAPYLRHPWPAELAETLSHLLWTAEVEKRNRVPTAAGTLPRFFSWLYPARLAGMSTPRRAGDIDALAVLGITHVLTLTEEEPLPESWFPPTITHLHVPVPNYAAPTLAEMDVIYARFMDGGTWLVHCGGGVGRAGTVLACLVAMLGRGGEVSDKPKLDARTAIGLVRAARPTSLETREQEAFVAAWVSHRWRRADTAPIEPVSRLVREGNVARAVVMIGRPGSGKSWLAAALSKRAGAVVVSGDDDGRAACERAAAQAAARPDTLFILDRCNPTLSERKEWLALLPSALAVYFDYTPALCAARLDARIGHPTLRAGRGANALAQMHRLMQPPRMEEGWAGILTISSFAAAREAALLIGGVPPLLKFPHTPHLLDLGAATADDIVAPAFKVVGPASVEEKLDGANMGFSLDWDGRVVAQNRSHWVSSASAPQFRTLDRFLADHDAALRRILGRDTHFPERYILYGEWMAARHSVHYDALPCVFVAFDLYDRVERSFVSRRVLERTMRGSGIPLTPLLRTVGEGESMGREEVLRLLQGQSLVGAERREGVYVRFEREGRTTGRGKVVRSDFIAGDAHWGRAPLVLNRFADADGS